MEERNWGLFEDSELDELIEEATVDCYGDEEAMGGWFAKLEEEILFCFDAEVLGIPVQVMGVRQRGSFGLVFNCRGNGTSQDIDILDFPLPDPEPKWARWVYAYRRWMQLR